MPMTTTQKVDLTKVGTGATAAGAAIAVAITHDAGQPYTEYEFGALALGFGAVIGYIVGWVELLKIAARRKIDAGGQTDGQGVGGDGEGPAR